MKPAASLSLDLDNLWSYQRSLGQSDWQSFPTYLPAVVPTILSSVRELDLALTVFVVGRDAEREENRDALTSIVDAGHHIGNHSYDHETWMHQKTGPEIADEIDRTHDLISASLGVEPDGFRGPGFCLSEQMIEGICRKGYSFDASLLPMSIGAIVRTVYFWSAKLSKDDREDRAQQFGTLADGFRPLSPFQWKLGDHRLLEIPVTTFPGVRTPFHLTYIHYLAQFSAGAARAYFSAALATCKRSGVEPSLLLHPTDFIAADRCPDLKSFPGFGKDSGKKLALTKWCLQAFGNAFEVESVTTRARALSAADLRETSFA